MLAVPFASVEVDDRAFLEGFRAAMDVFRDVGELVAVEIADKVVLSAKELVPKRTGQLAESIHREAPIRHRLGVSVEVKAGGPGIRETIFMEFGTYKDRPHPYMRPAFARAAGALRGAGFSARLAYSHQARLFVRRMQARAKVRRLQRRGQLRITGAEARQIGREISSRMAFRRPRRRAR